MTRIKNFIIRNYLSDQNKIFKAFKDLSPRTQQWLWFILLWIFGFATVTVLTYPIKLLVRFMK